MVLEAVSRKIEEEEKVNWFTLRRGRSQSQESCVDDRHSGCGQGMDMERRWIVVDDC